MKKTMLAGLLSAAAALAPLSAAWSDDSYPRKPVRIIAPVPPGGGGDFVTRLVANAASQELGQSIVVENRPGATGNIGTVAAVRSAPDGYTILLCSIGNCAVNASLYANPGYDLFKDIAPVALVGSSINVLTVNLETGITSVAELLEQAGKHPLNYGSSGVGASNHLAGEMLKKVSGADILHVPYKGSGPAITDLIGGSIQVFFDNEPSILPHIQAGKVRALAVTGKTRSENLPDVPTMEELGFKGFVIEPWYGIGAPAGTPESVINRLNDAVNRGLSKPEVRETLLKAGITPASGDAGVLKAHIRSEYEKWADLIASQKISAE
ncbi:Bug family tripartite tricarboxylate transporter substrate binding protein [Paracandidimonas soli]|uniref:Tripartite-type tricarboxylate transporter receptor subunit TctC n=1 Tax=Paracandidimonas soli TaxID=1917182 RepID=A0A4R3V6F0_9BURK|nr:tripartite tricarboxylate transporter substrate binding protein [Paracandidimonas soli]TCU98993.1 tripartite-type tricarboxylate transporter receptor subunit TctC [Paracandidimonas soli]